MSTSTEKQGLEIVYVDDRLARSGYLTVYVGDAVTQGEFRAIADVLRDQTGVNMVEPFFEGTTAALHIYASHELTGRAKAELLELLSPRYTRKVSASATVQRDDDGVHRSTRITMKVTAGENLTGFNKDRALDNQNGALRVRVIERGTTLVFLMQHPVANNDNGEITEIVERMAEQLGAMVAQPIVVNEYDENAALDPSKDYKPAA